MEENKKMATTEGSVQQQPMQLTIEITNLHELEQLITDINKKLTQLKNFKLQVDAIK